MSIPDKNEAAEKLAQAHMQIDSGVTRIFRLVSSPDREADPAEPIKLLEVYEYAIPSGILPVHFPAHPASGLLYPTEIVQIAPEEFERVCNQELQLPEGWDLDQEYERPRTANEPAT